MMIVKSTNDQMVSNLNFPENTTFIACYDNEDTSKCLSF